MSSGARPSSQLLHRRNFMQSELVSNRGKLLPPEVPSDADTVDKRVAVSFEGHDGQCDVGVSFLNQAGNAQEVYSRSKRRPIPKVLHI